MGNQGKKAVILEKLVSISLAQLRALNFFNKSEGYKSLPVDIKRKNGLCIDSYSIRITVSTQQGNSYVSFDYTIDGKPVNYKVSLVQLKNHVTGKFTFYFKCNVSKKRCRKLYLHGTKFISREAIANRYYLRDTLSKKQRSPFEFYKRITSLEKAIVQRSEKHFKVYNKKGQHTIKMKKVMTAKEQLKHISQARNCA